MYVAPGMEKIAAIKHVTICSY